MYPVTEQEICQVITNLKNASAGHDGIDAKILKIIKSHVIKPITHICVTNLGWGSEVNLTQNMNRHDPMNV